MITALVATRTAAGRYDDPPPPRFYEERHRDKRGAAISWHTLLAVASAGLLSYGVWLLAVSASSPAAARQDGLPRYAQAVARWPDARAAFAALHVTVQSSTTYVAPMQLTSEDVRDDERVGLESFPPHQALVHRARSSAAGGPTSEGRAEGLMPLVHLEDLHKQLESFHSHHLHEHIGPNVSFEFYVRDGPQTSSFQIGPYPLVRVRLVAALGPQPSTKCRQQLKGLYSSGKCWVLSLLKRICVQVAAGQDGWRPAVRPSDPARSNGCVYVTGDPGHWESAAYELLPVTHAEGAGMLSSDSVVELRSHEDPHLRALELTDGSLDLRRLVAEDRVVGFVLLGLSVVFAVPPCVVAIWGAQIAAPRTSPRVSGPAARRVGREYVGLGDDRSSRSRC